MTSIYHPHAPSTRPEHQEATWRNLDTIARAGFRVLHWPCHASHDEAVGLRLLWGSDALIVVEHDLVLGLKQVRELSECRHDVCAFGYERVGGWGHYHAMADDSFTWNGSEGDSWADGTYLGCVKFSLHAQQLIAPGVHMSYLGIDTMIGDQLRKVGLPVHMHWPAIPHLHAGWELIRAIEESA